MRNLVIVAISGCLILSCSSKPENKIPRKKFKEPETTAVFTTKFVLIDKHDITTVYHDKEDGAWQFVSDDQFDDFATVAKIVGLGQIVKIDSSLTQLADMPLGYFAHRKTKNDGWLIEPSK